MKKLQHKLILITIFFTVSIFSSNAKAEPFQHCGPMNLGQELRSVLNDGFWPDCWHDHYRCTAVSSLPWPMGSTTYEWVYSGFSNC